jgi:hypothetical protein
MNIFGVDTTNMAAFDAAYVASLPPALQGLMAMPIGDPTSNLARATAALKLAQQGYAIDYNIMVLGADPWLIMNQRVVADGLRWGPSALQSGPANPFTQQSGPVPAGAITYSINISDYPPFAPVVPAPPAPTVSPVGPDMSYVDPNTGKEVYAAQAGDPYPLGYRWTDASGVYVKVGLGSELMNPTQRVAVWEKQ